MLEQRLKRVRGERDLFAGNLRTTQNKLVALQRQMGAGDTMQDSDSQSPEDEVYDTSLPFVLLA